MRIFRPLYFMLIMVPQIMSGQINAKIADVNFRLDNNIIVVEYSIINVSPEDHFTIGLKFITETNQVIIPKSVKGDVGKNIEAGIGKTIIWDIVADRLEFSGALKAIVTITPSEVNSNGPYYALLSVVIPGLGGYFVEEKKVRAVITTISTLSLMTYGILEKTKSDKFYADYKQSINYEDINALYDKANSIHHKSYIAIRIAAVVWIADVIWVARKGVMNLKENRSGQKISSDGGFTLNYINSEFQLGYKVTF